MKIGILTFADVPNFGANLQAMSTISYLKSKGHEPILIKWEPCDFIARFASIKDQVQPKAHYDFVSQYLPATDLCHNDEDICNVISKLSIEAVIIGSDAVLQHIPFRARVSFPTKTIIRIADITSERVFPNAFWGSFYCGLKKKIPLAIMSASSQNSRYNLITEKERKQMLLHLSRFSYISVRDIWTRDMLKCISSGTIVAPVTPDPVFAFNQNCASFILDKKTLLEKYSLPENYLLLSFKSPDIVSKSWLYSFYMEAKKNNYNCVALPMPTGVMFEHPFNYEINTPLSPLDWYALIKYSKGYVGENMHPIVVALHNSVPCYCFDTYGVLKYSRCMYIKKSSKIYDILSSFSLLDNRCNAYFRFWKCPTANFIINKINNFDINSCREKSDFYYNSYLNMMATILDKFDKYYAK